MLVVQDGLGEIEGVAQRIDIGRSDPRATAPGRSTTDRLVRASAPEAVVRSGQGRPGVIRAQRRSSNHDRRPARP